MSINYSELSITVITNVLFISLFLGLFFFTYAAYIEQSVVKDQMAFLSNEISSSVKILGPDISDQFKTYINSLPNINLEDADKTVEQMNKNTKFNAIIANLVFTIFVAICVYGIYSRSDKSFSISEILIKNFIILIFVALTEFIFLTYFGSKFISLNPNLIVHNLISHAKTFYNSLNSV